MSRVQIDPDAAEAFGAAIHATAGELQTAVASLTDDVASLPPDAAAIAGADAVLSVTAAAAGRFAGETGELKDLLGLAAVLARRPAVETGDGCGRFSNMSGRTIA